MKRVNIPKRFNLLGRTITVQLSDAPAGHGTCGIWESAEDRITIYTGEHSNRSSLEQTFLHEAVHGILERGGYTEEAANEQLVDLLASLIHQMLASSYGKL